MLCKLEGNNPAGSVKDRPALNMFLCAEQRGEIKPGDVLIEATSGNTGIALAMVAAVKGYRMKLVMPENMSEERTACMRAYGAEIISVPEEGGMERARDLAEQMVAAGEGKMLDQFANDDNWRSHYFGTAPEIWRDTDGEVSHFVSSMGTTGTIMGVSRFLKEQNKRIEVVGVQPQGESKIPGIRRWPVEYLPKIFDPGRVDIIHDVSRETAEDTMRELAIQEGIFAGISSGGTVAVAIQVARRIAQRGELATIVAIICDRGDRYVSTGVYG